MSRYAEQHHPQVQERKIGRLNKNDYSLSAYISVLRRLGHTDTARLNKAEAFNRVRTDPQALSLLMDGAN